MERAYSSRINWENEPSVNTPINDINLNKMDAAIYTIDGRVVGFDTTKANQSDLLLSVKNINYNTSTGVFVFTWQNGTTLTVDLNIEKIPVSFSMTPQGVIKMVTSDGTEYTADVSALIKTYTFVDSGVIDFTVTTDASGNKTVTANIVDGSITDSKMQPNYLADITEQANKSETKSLVSEGYAVGEQNGVPVDQSSPYWHNNAKYYAEHSGTSTLTALSDVDINNPQENDALVYNPTTQKWENKEVVSGEWGAITGDITDQTDLADALNTKINKSNISEAWDASRTYYADNYCINDNKIWKCKVQNSGQTPVEGTYWTLVTVLGEISTLNTNLVNQQPSIIYESQSFMNVNDTIDLSSYINDLNQDDVLMFCARRYAYAGSVTFTKRQLLNNFYGSGFIIWVDSNKYYKFSLDSFLTLKLLASTADALPYVHLNKA